MAAPAREEISLNKSALLVCLSLMLLTWLGAGIYAVYSRDLPTAFLIVYIGLFIGVGVGLYIAFPPQRRPLARRLMMLMLGSLLLYLAFASDHGNMQIEGLFFGLLVGSANYIILHYALAKLIGPFVFGRVWCGWACWYGMVLDLLPYPYSRYRIPGRWGLLRYAHFVVSLLLVLALWFGLGYHNGALGASGYIWFVAGLLLYYALGIGLAFALRDNRAFCKYLCPIAVPLKAGARFALLKVDGLASKCDDCQVCVELCPMNVRITDYILNGQRVLSSECTLCQHCINVCPRDALKLSIGFDAGLVEHIDYEPPKRRPRPSWQLPFAHH